MVRKGTHAINNKNYISFNNNIHTLNFCAQVVRAGFETNTYDAYLCHAFLEDNRYSTLIQTHGFDYSPEPEQVSFELASCPPHVSGKK